jgi:hypothetical protein
MRKKTKDIEKTTEKKPDIELSEKELEKTTGGIGEQYGRQPTPKTMPYIEQENLRK